MFFVLSKLIYGLLMPVSLIAIAFCIAVFSKNKSLKKKARIIGITLVFFFTNPFLANIAINLWEPTAINYSDFKEKYDYGIVLTGITDPMKAPKDRVHFNKGADRIIHTIDLYKKGIIRKIIVSGGSGSLLNPEKSESNSLKSILLTAGIPEEDILLESNSRNTYENAQYSKQLLQRQDSNAKILLITSAFHLRRASGCFEKANIQFDIFPTDKYSKPLSYTPDEIIIPHIDAAKVWTILFKEWIGYSAYLIVGYL